MQVQPIGDGALMLEVDDPLAWFALLSAERAGGRLDVLDIVPGARTVLLDGVDQALAGHLAALPDPGPVPHTGATLEVPVEFDGPDLLDVAELAGLSTADLVEALATTPLRVAFCGFAPGFAYLAGLPWTVPRLATPRAKVSAGSVALAAEYAGIYPTASPGGWRIVGHSDAVLFDVHRDPPALLEPGRTVRLVPGRKLH